MSIVGWAGNGGGSLFTEWGGLVAQIVLCAGGIALSPPPPPPSLARCSSMLVGGRKVQK